MSRKPISVEVRDEADGRFVVVNYSNGDGVHGLVDPDKRPTRKPRRPPTKLGLDRFDKTRKKRI